MATKFQTGENCFKSSKCPDHTVDLAPWLPILTAIAQGKTIQLMASGPYGTWGNMETVSLSEDVSKYRIKPEPRKGVGTDQTGYVWVHPLSNRVIVSDFRPGSDWIRASIDYTWTEIDLEGEE